MHERCRPAQIVSPEASRPETCKLQDLTPIPRFRRDRGNDERALA